MVGSFLNAQQNYNDFEGNCYHLIDFKSGKLNVRAKNPESDSINSSNRCAKYTRTSFESFDNLKLVLKWKLKDVSAYANYNENSPRIRMKVFTSATPGTLIEIQLGKNTAQDYPVNVHSQYHAKTTKQNEWEELEFSFSQIPKGSLVKHGEVNQIVILFAPNTKEKQVFYFDDLTGPLFVESKLKIRKL